MAALRRNESLGRLHNFSDLTTKLMRHAASFISAFDNSEPRMRQIVEEFQKIVDEVTKMQQKTDERKRKGVVAGGLGLGLMILAAPFTGGTSLLAAAGGLAAVGGGAAVVLANVTKIREEKESARKVEELGKEFMKIVELLKNNLEEIKTTCEELKRPSMTVQAAVTLSDMEEFQRIVGRVSKLRERTGEVLVVTAKRMKVVDDMLKLILRMIVTPEEDQNLRDSIRQSADQCQKVTNAFDRMKMGLLVIMEETKFWERVAADVSSS